MLVDPEKTTHLGKPVGKDSSLSSWQGDQWKMAAVRPGVGTPMIHSST